MVGFFAYILYLLMNRPGAVPLGPILAGRPLPWLLLQALALVAAGAAVATALAWRRAGGAVPVGERLRLGVLLAGGGIFVPWAIHWGLLLP